MKDIPSNWAILGSGMWMLATCVCFYSHAMFIGSVCAGVTVMVILLAIKQIILKK